MRKFLLAALFILLTAVCAMATPVVTVSSPVNNATVSTTFTLNATAVPTSGDSIGGWHTYIDNVDETAQACGSTCGNSYSATFTVAAGKHTVLVRAWDFHGTTYGDGTVSITATSGSVSVSATSPAASASLCSPINVIASATTTNTGANITGWDVYDLNNASAVLYNTPGPVSSINTNITASAGAQSWQIKAFDSTGASNFVNVAFTVTTTGCSGGGGGGGTIVNPTTTLTAERDCNSAAWSGFTDQANGDEGCHNVSLLNVHNLLYTGNTTLATPNVMLWWCENNPTSPIQSWTTTCNGHGHAEIGYQSFDSAEIKKQADEMASQGYDTVELDWYGRNDWQNTAAQNWVTELQSRSTGLGSNLKYWFMIDHEVTWTCGSGAWSGSGYASLTSCLYGEIDADLDYMNTHWWGLAKAFKVNGHPLVIFFISESSSAFTGADWTTVWNTVRSHANAMTPNGTPDLLFENAGGFTHTGSDGAYLWITPCQPNGSGGYNCPTSGDTSANDWDKSDIDWYYGQYTANHFTEYGIGAGWKGFDDRYASWSAPAPNQRFLPQQCGMTWIDSMSETSSYFSTTKQLPMLLIPTWNDYEEATETESGIDNCYTISSTLNGSTLSWSLGGTGNPATSDHYTVYVSTDQNNLSVLQDNIATSTTTLNLSNYTLAGGTYSVYVKLFSKSGLRTEITSPVTYTTVNTQIPPTAALTVSPLTGKSPFETTANGSTSVGGSTNTITQMVIDWGDGTTPDTLTAAVYAPNWAKTHIYIQDGTYSITNTVTNSAGLSATSAAQTVIVTSTPAGAALSNLTDGSYVYSPLRVQGTITGTVGPIAHARIIIDGTTVFDKAITGTTYNLDKYVFLSGGAYHTVKIEGVDSATPTPNVYDSATVKVFCVGHAN